MLAKNKALQCFLNKLHLKIGMKEITNIKCTIDHVNQLKQNYKKHIQSFKKKKEIKEIKRSIIY